MARRKFSCTRWLAIGVAFLASVGLSRPLAAQATTTVITHGFHLDDCFLGGPPCWTFSMAEEILAASPEGKGAVFQYDPGTGEWKYKSGNSSASQHIVLIFDWVEESDGGLGICTIPGINWSYAEAAGDALFAALRDSRGDLTIDPLQNRFLHFIGHSRGASVNSEAVRRLAADSIPVDHVTTLDPHPVDGNCGSGCNWLDPFPHSKWSPNTWVDNYFRHDACTEPCDQQDPNGVALPYGFNFDLTDALDEDSLDGLFCWAEHKKVHAWYSGTIQGNVDDNCGCDINPDAYDGTNPFDPGCTSPACQGSYYSRLGGGAGNRPSQSSNHADPGNPPAIHNGRFDLGYSGWLYHGGSGSAAVVAEGSNWYLRLTPSQPSRAHNRFFLSGSDTELSFRYKVFATSSDDVLLVNLNDPSGGGYALAQQPLSSVSGWQTITVPISAAISRNESYLLDCRLESLSGPATATVGVDNLSITSTPGSALSIASVTWDDPGGDGDGIPEAGEEGISLLVCLTSSVDVQSVQAHVTISGCPVTVTDDTVDYGLIGQGEVDCDDDFDFDFSTIPDSCSLTAFIDVTYSIGGAQYSQQFDVSRYIPIQGEFEPVFEVCEVVIDDALRDCGNGDGQAHSGEHIEVHLNLRNIGNAPAHDVEVHIQGDGSSFHCFDSFPIDYPVIPPGSGCIEPEDAGDTWSFCIPRQLAGTFSFDVVIEYDSPLSPFVISGHQLLDIQQAPWVYVQPPASDFGVANVGDIVTVPFAIRNDGNAPMDLEAVQINPPSQGTTVTGPPLPHENLAPGDQLEFSAHIDTSGMSLGPITRRICVVSDGFLCDDSDDNCIVISGLVTQDVPFFDVPTANPVESTDTNGTFIVWAENRYGGSNSFDIFGYDLITGIEYEICVQTGEQFRPRIEGDIVAWEDERAGDNTQDIYAYDLITQTEFAVSTDARYEYLVGVGNGFVAFIRTYYVFDSQFPWHGAYNLYVYDVNTGQTTQVTTYSGNGSQPMPSVDRSLGRSDAGGNMIGWAEFTFEVDQHGTWVQRDDRVKKITVGSDSSPVEIWSPVVSIYMLSVNDGRVAVSTDQNTDEVQVWLWQGGTWTRVTLDDETSHGEDDLALGMDAVVYDKRGFLGLFATCLGDGVEFFLPPDESVINGSARMHSSNVIWVNPTTPTSTLRYTFLKVGDPAVAPANITFSNEDPYTDESFDVSALIQNLARWDALDPIDIELFDGDPRAGGQQLASTTLQSLSAQSSQLVEFTGVQISIGGFHDLCVRISTPVLENPANNVACKSIDVHERGACCREDLPCVGDSTPAECANLPGGMYLGDGTVCQDCPISENGPCCFADGSCVFPTTVQACTAAGGEFQGIGMTCQEVFCCDPTCSADIADVYAPGCDGVVDIFDLLELLRDWGANGPGAGIAAPFDVVDVFDLLELLRQWGACS